MMLGKAITELAQEKNMSKYRIAKNSGVPQATLNEIANGKNKNPTMLTVIKIAEGIGVKVSFLIERAESIEHADEDEEKYKE